jgi:uncharacterized protein (DUF2236 family)
VPPSDSLPCGGSIDAERPYAGSVAWKINAERVVLLGWAPAILMQLAHPLVAAGVAQHSQFRAGLGTRLARLRSTVDSMLMLTFGTRAQAREAAEKINRIHDRVNGRLGEGGGVWPSGVGYSAHDPALLRWVYATLVDVLPRAYELYVGPLTEEERERYCREATGVAPLLGVPDGYLPASRGELRDYMARTYRRGEVRVGQTARELADALLHPPWLGPLTWPARLAAIGFLPPELRRQYGFAWGRRHEAVWRASALVVRAGLPHVPAALRYWPAARDRDLRRTDAYRLG